MAAQQNVRHENLSKKKKSSKIIANSVNEESSNSGKKSGLGSGSLCKDSESSTVDNNLSHENLNKKEGISKNKAKKKDNELLQNDREVGKNFKTDSALSEKNLEKASVDVSIGANCSSGSEVLSKSKKRRLRKRKYKLAHVSPHLCESVDVSCKITSNVKDSKSSTSRFKVAAILEEANKKADDQSLVELNKNLDCHGKLPVPLPDSTVKSLIESISVPNNCHKYPADILSSFLTASNISSKVICKSSDKVVVQSDEDKSRNKEHTVTAHGLNDILFTITQTLNANDEIIQKGCTSNQCSLKVDEQGKNKKLCNHLSLNGKINESHSKLESTEKLLCNSALDKFSGGKLDNDISKYRTETKDVTSPVRVGYSSGVLQVNDTNNTVAETQQRNIKGISCEITNQVNTTMDVNGDSAKPSSKGVKSREEIIAEREAKKAAKLAAKKAKVTGVKHVPEKVSDVVDGCIIEKKPLVSSNIIIEDNRKSSSEKDLLPESNLDLKKNQESKQPPSKKPEAEGKSKAELRAERREKQEAQRAAKVAQKVSGKEGGDKISDKELQKESPVKEKNIEVSVKDSEIKETTSETKYKVKLFSHLYLEKELFQDYDCCNIHPAVLQLGAQYEARVISGSNARCLGLLHTLKRMFSDYSTPLKQEFSRGLEAMLVKSMNYLNYCRPSSVSMSNAVRHIRRHLTQLPNNIPDSEARQKLYEVIDTYVREQIDVAGEAICNTVQKKINNGDVILIYGCSSLVYRILLESHKSGTKFSVVVVDAGPWFEGREMLRRLVREGLKCSYIVITAASFIMREASKVLLGAHALLANGYVMSRAGTSQVALLAHSYNVPVLVCCETHKFSERVQTDAFVYNELGDPDELVSVKTKPALQWRNYDCLMPLSIAFDVTPPDLVTAVVTELGILPCTSVPVILRIKPSEIV